MNWDPAKHPRTPAGSPDGGQFTVSQSGVIEFTGQRKWEKMTKKSAIELKKIAQASGVNAGVFVHRGAATIPGRGFTPFENFYVKVKK